MLPDTGVVVALCLAAALSGCGKQLFAQLTEADANDMLTVLLRADIDAAKSSPDDGKSWVISVDEDDFARAMEALHAHGLRDGWRGLQGREPPRHRASRAGRLQAPDPVRADGISQHRTEGLTT